MLLFPFGSPTRVVRGSLYGIYPLRVIGPSAHGTISSLYFVVVVVVRELPRDINALDDEPYVPI